MKRCEYKVRPGARCTKPKGHTGPHSVLAVALHPVHIDWWATCLETVKAMRAAYARGD